MMSVTNNNIDIRFKHRERTYRKMREINDINVLETVGHCVFCQMFAVRLYKKKSINEYSETYRGTSHQPCSDNKIDSERGKNHPSRKTKLKKSIFRHKNRGIAL